MGQTWIEDAAVDAATADVCTTFISESNLKIQNDESSLETAQVKQFDIL